MTVSIPRLRMFAGPNGFGKSTLKHYLPEKLLGVYLNPDDIEQEIRRLGFLDLSSYGVTVTSDMVRPFFVSSNFLKGANLTEAAHSPVTTLTSNQRTYGATECHWYPVTLIAENGFPEVGTRQKIQGIS